MTGNDAPTSQVEMAQQVIRYLVAAGRWRGKQRVGWRNNELLHDELVDSLEELPEDLEESLQTPLRHQLLELHRVQEGRGQQLGNGLTSCHGCSKESATGGRRGGVCGAAGGGVSPRRWGRCAARRCPGGDGGAARREVPGSPLWGQGPAGGTEARSPPIVQSSSVVAVKLAPCVDDGVAQLL